ncbi:hypothetical protein BHM03_00060829 [Ensete ventricosum]|nr:hypothetical protein BHM03_00060829 [Ensete ventricosum]
MVSRTSMVSRKNMTVINFVRSHAQSRVSIGFSCTISKIQNTNHSQRNNPWEVVRAWFHKKTRRSYICANCALCRVSIGFSCTIPQIQNIGHSRCISPW